MDNNNHSDTVLHSFKKAIDEYDLPSEVRMDGGGENLAVASYVVEHPECGPDRGSAITGRSSHNQRIERLLVRYFFWMCIIFLLLLLSLGRYWASRCKFTYESRHLHFVFLLYSII